MTPFERVSDHVLQIGLSLNEVAKTSNCYFYLADFQTLTPLQLLARMFPTRSPS